MKRLAGIMAAALLLAAGGQAIVWAQGGKIPTYPVVPLNVAIALELSTGAPTKITGDADGPYVNGAPDGTTANIDKYGNLIIKFGRPVTFDYTVQAPLSERGVVIVERDNSYISTLNAHGKPLQDLAPPSLDVVEGESQCIKLNWQYDIPGGWLRHGFNRGFDQSLHDGTSYAVVTRTGPTTWVLEPRPGNSVEPTPGNCVIDPAYYPNAGGIYLNPDGEALVFSQVSAKGKWRVEEYGTYSLPFRLTLTRQP